MKALRDINVLLVEDDEDTRDMIRDMLSEFMVLNVEDAASGAEALEYLKDHSNVVDVIICDWNMPQISGLQLLQALRKQDRDIPFLMVTGRADNQSVIEAKEAGVTAYILKPFQAGELEAKMRIISALPEVG